MVWNDLISQKMANYTCPNCIFDLLDYFFIFCLKRKTIYLLGTS